MASRRAEVVRAIAVSEATYHRWRAEYGGLKLDAVKQPRKAECTLARHLDELAGAEEVTVSIERLARFAAVTISPALVAAVEAAAARGLRSRRLTSGVGHDAQMMARICPAAMILVPSTGSISHNPGEHTPDAVLATGAEVLLDVVVRLTRATG